MAKLAFLGLGVMGAPMAGHLQKAGHEVTVWNRTRSKAEAWVQVHGGAMADSPAQAAQECEVVLACVGNDDHISAVTMGEEGAFAGMSPGAVFVDHSSVSADVTQRMNAQAEAAGLGFIDAPVSGGQAGAETARLGIMCGGRDAEFQKVQAILDIYAVSVALIGPSGSGQKAKYVNQIAIAGVVQGLAEALAFADKAGLDSEKLLSVITTGAAGSWQMSNRAKTMLADQFEFGFAVDWMRKDLKNCLRAADDLNVSLPLTALVDQFYKDVQAMGGGNWDTSSLIKRLK